MKINVSFNLADAPKIADQQSNLFDLDLKSNFIPVNFHNNTIGTLSNIPRCLPTFSPICATLTCRDCK